MNHLRNGSPVIKTVAMLLVLQIFALPLLAQQQSNQALSTERIEEIKAEAESMCADVDTTGYGFGGFLCGIFGWIAAVSSKATPPAEALVQYNAAEQEIFISAYEKCVKGKRTKAACTGWATGTLFSLLIMNSGGAQ